MIDSYPTINLKHIANSTCIIMSKASNQDVASDSAASSAKSSAAAAMVPLPDDFTPCNADVLCGRGKKNYNSIGNQRLRRIVDSYVEQYQAAASRQDKSDILSEIVDQVRSASPKGGFVKQDPVTNKVRRTLVIVD